MGLTKSEVMLKRAFDVVFSGIGLILSSPLIVLGYIFASLSTKSCGFFLQERVGKDCKLFKVIKLKTMKPMSGVITTVTTSEDPRITKVGMFLRKYKIDELPQLINVFIGQMSFVGPRPDVKEFADMMLEHEKIIFTIKPGITGPATIKYRNEEKLLSTQVDPERYNKEIIFPDKIKINMEYVRNWSLYKDIMYIVRTIL